MPVLEIMRAEAFEHILASMKGMRKNGAFLNQ
jgi:hypothetical protein